MDLTIEHIYQFVYTGSLIVLIFFTIAMFFIDIAEKRPAHAFGNFALAGVGVFVCLVRFGFIQG